MPTKHYELSHQLKGPTKAIHCLAISKDGRFLASRGEAVTIPHLKQLTFPRFRQPLPMEDAQTPKGGMHTSKLYPRPIHLHVMGVQAKQVLSHLWISTRILVLLERARL